MKVIKIAAGLFLLALLLVLMREIKPWRRQFARSTPALPEGKFGTRPAPRPTMLGPHLRLALSPGRREDDVGAKEGELRGTVVDRETRLGIPRAGVTLLHAGRAVTEVADDQGAFVLRAFEPGEYQIVSVEAEGYWPFIDSDQAPPTYVARKGARISGGVLHLWRRHHYTAVVIGTDGDPVQDALVRMQGSATGDDQQLRSDAKGLVKLDGRPGWVIIAEKAPGASAAVLLRGGSDFVTLTLRSDDGSLLLGSITGRVVGPEGQPVPEAFVTADPEDALAITGTRTAVAGPDGSFVLLGLVVGMYDLSASGIGLAPGQLRGVRTGSKNTELRLDTDGGALRGFVRTATGEPLTSFVLLVTERRGDLERSAVQPYSIFDSNGAYLIENLRPNTYAIRAVAHGYGMSEESTATVIASRTSTADLTVHSACVLFGRVVEKGSGTPVKDARISIERDMVFHDVPLDLSSGTASDADGQFELGGLSPGSTAIMVIARTHHGRIVSSLRLEEGQRTGPITVALAPIAQGDTPRIQYEGIGVQLTVQADDIVVDSVFRSGAAERAGLVAGDVILRVDGIDVHTIGIDAAMQMIRGPEGTVVRLLLRRPSGEIQEIPVVRRSVG